MKLLRAFIVFYFASSVQNWRALRRLCLKRLPQTQPKVSA